MKILYDGPAKRLIEYSTTYPELIAGQLLSPTTCRKRAFLDGPFAIDNGAYAGFDAGKFERLLTRQAEHKANCLFVVPPDVVGSARRTLECFDVWYPLVSQWPIGLAMQDGMEDFDIDWGLIAAVFIGGSTEWKMSDAAADIVKAAKIIGKHVHIGRITTPNRFKYFEDLGADTCDGNAVNRWDETMEAIANRHFEDTPLLNTLPNPS